MFDRLTESYLVDFQFMCNNLSIVLLFKVMKTGSLQIHNYGYPLGDPKSRNGGTTERWNGGQSLQMLKDGTAD